MKPTLGRIVHVKHGPSWMAAIVVQEVIRGFVVRVFAVSAEGALDWSTVLQVADEGDAWRWPPHSPANDNELTRTDLPAIGGGQ
jgi:hypothetical protein